MALEGNIKEFGLADIFQLIGLQKKTGILFLKGEDETVNIHFEDGMVVKSDESKKRPRCYLGHIMITRGKLTEAKLRECMEIQKNTGQKLGGVLISQGIINKDDLRDALSFQIKEAVYRVFRWKNGDYKFDQERVDYDRDTIVPLSTEHILMDGIRMLDEWPQIQKKLPSMSIVLKKSDAVADEEADNDIFAGFADKGHESGASSDSKHILGLVNGKKSIYEIMEYSRLGEFDTCKMLVDLLDKRILSTTGSKSELLSEAISYPSEKPLTPSRVPSLMVFTVYGFFAVALFIIFMQLTGTRKIMNPHITRLEDLKEPFSVSMVNKAGQAMTSYYFDFGSYPESVVSLEQLDYIASRDTIDPWGGSLVIEHDDAGDHFIVSAGPDKALHSQDDIKSGVNN